MGGLEGQEVRPEDYRKVVAHVNLALTELYKRFWLSSCEVKIDLYDHISIYHLNSKYAQTNTLSTELYKYISDSQEHPFTDNVLKIEEVFDELGHKVCLNDLNEQGCSFYTPSYNSIQVPLPFIDASISVHYRGNHPRIKYIPGFDPTKVEVELPDGLLEALLVYVGGRATRVLNSDQNAESNNYKQLFEDSCKRAEALGLQITPQYSNLKLDYKGFV